MSDTTIDFLYLSEQDMIKAGVMDMAKCEDAMEAALELLYRGDYRMAGANNDSHGAMVTFPKTSPFPKMPTHSADRRFMAMPSYLGGQFHMAGVKWYGSNIENRAKGLPRSILMLTLNDADTGAPVAFMSANILSAYRTGAVGGVGARYLAKKDAKSVGILGPGVMGKTALAAFVAARPAIDTLKVKGRSEKSTADFVAWVKATFPQITSITVVGSEEAVVRGSDIISYCSSGMSGDIATYPLVKREWLNPGAFLSMPSLLRIDAAMETPEVKKVMDNTRLYEAWYEEEEVRPAFKSIPIIGVHFQDLIHEGKMDKSALVDIGKIIAGEAPARENDEEIILMSIGGMAIEDVAWGTEVYRNALANGIGVKLNLWDTPVLH